MFTIDYEQSLVKRGVEKYLQSAKWRQSLKVLTAANDRNMSNNQVSLIKTN